MLGFGNAIQLSFLNVFQIVLFLKIYSNNIYINITLIYFKLKKYNNKYNMQHITNYTITRGQC